MGKYRPDHDARVAVLQKIMATTIAQANQQEAVPVLVEDDDGG